jgi:hypothetical protein
MADAQRTAPCCNLPPRPVCYQAWRVWCLFALNAPFISSKAAHEQHLHLRHLQLEARHAVALHL